MIFMIFKSYIYFILCADDFPNFVVVFYIKVCNYLLYSMELLTVVFLNIIRVTPTEAL
jgi:hypothetical protein